MDLSVDFCGLSLRNPLISGSCDNSRSISQFRKVVESGIGAIVMKSITDVASLQNPKIAKFLCLNTELKPWRLGQQVGGFFSRGGAMLNKSEWKNIVVEELHLAEENHILLIGNICASSLGNWSYIAKTMEDAGIKLIELNLGNPFYTAIKKPMGARIVQSEEILTEVIETVTQAVSVPVIAKLSPQVSNIVQVARAVKKAGASGVTISHRFQGFIIDVQKREPLSSSLFGYGGPWMLPIALGYVAKVSREVQVPICGSGGIYKWSDVLQFIMTGATTVQVTTALMLYGSQIIQRILNRIEEYCERNNITKLEELVGSALGKVGYYDKLTGAARVLTKNTSLCLQCNDRPCLQACFFDAIKETEDRLIAITDDCTACGLCLQVCPFSDALALEER